MDRIDVLNRDAFVKQLVNLIENIAESGASVSFAIDGTWGCGKSFVLDMLEDQLMPIQSERTSTDKYMIIRYDCWKYDYYEEPLVAIVATIIDTIDERTKLLYGEQGEKIKGILKAVGTALLSISNNMLKTAVGIDTDKVFDIVKSGVNAGKEKYEEMREYDVFFGLKQTLHSLQDVLNEISKQYTLVFFVDELDRCLPEYAIKVLERLHHLTESTQNIINIIAIDKTQLQASVQRIFGFENADKYLKKFIQFSIPLDIGHTSEKIVDKYHDYISLFDATLIPIKDSIEEYIQALFENVDIREQEQLVRRAMLAHELLYSDVKDYSFMCVELLIITIEFCYQGKKAFTEWLQSFGMSLEVHKHNPPFSSLFDDKIEKILYSTNRYSGMQNMYQHIFHDTDSLYAIVAYTWYELFLKNPHKSISIVDGATKDLLRNNVVELKKFAKMVRLMK